MFLYHLDNKKVKRKSMPVQVKLLCNYLCLSTIYKLCCCNGRIKQPNHILKFSASYLS